MNRKHTLILLILFLSYGLNISAQSVELRRKGFLGISPEMMNDSLALVTGLEKGKGILIKQVYPNSTASGLKIEAKDVLLTLQGKAVNSLSQLTPAMKDLYAGDQVEVTVWRDKKEKKLKGVMIGKPLESSETADILYGQVKFREGYLRTILTKPKTGKAKYPGILFIPGYTCASIDNFPAFHPYKKLVDALTEKGYAVLRVEKPGLGDSYNTPDCYGIDFLTEVEAFEKGYEQLLSYDFVDKQNVFIFGHSLGGLEAPVIAAKYRPRGVIVFGTRHEPWMEYLLQMLRFQNPLNGVDYVEAEKDMRNYHTLLYEHFVLKKTPKELSQNPEFKALLIRDFGYDGEDELFSRHYIYGWSIHDQNITEAWKNTDSHVLSMWGEADFEALDPNSHKTIVEIVNHYHPGKGTYQFVPRTNHSMIEVGDMKEGVKVQQRPDFRDYMGQHFNYKMVEMMDEWMKAKIDHP